MAAHLGTGVQIAAVGPQNRYLDADPEVTPFYTRPKQSTPFAAEAVEELPLQTVKLGTTAVFQVPPRGDLLGDMHVQIRVPAVQLPLGSLPPVRVQLPDGLPRSEPTDEFGLEVRGRMVAVALPYFVDCSTFPLPEGRGRAWCLHEAYEGTSIVVYSDGRIEVTCAAEAPYRVAVRVRGIELASLSPSPHSTLAMHVADDDDTIVTANDVWPDGLAYALMRRVRFSVDDVGVHDHERLWYQLLDSLTVRPGHVAGLAEMLGASLSMGREHTLLLPLKFFGRHAFFPSVLVPKCRTVVELELEAFAACLPARLRAPCSEPAELPVRLVVERVVLDSPERNVMLRQAEWTMMVEGAQDVDALNYVVDGEGTAVVKPDIAVDLSELNLPVKALVWVVFRERVDRMFDYVDAVDSATLLFGSLERVSARGDTFSKQQVWTHGARCQPGNVYMYSFALAAHEWAPSGTVDFSALAKPVLRLHLKPEHASSQLKCKVWGMTYNWLKFHGGKMAHVFST